MLLSISDSNVALAGSKLQKYFDRSYEWLKLNVTKTKYMVINR